MTNPANRSSLLAGILAAKIDAFLGRKLAREAGEAGRVEGADQPPVDHQPQVGRDVDLLAKPSKLGRRAGGLVAIT